MEQEIEKRKRVTREESEEEKWVYDGSVDYKGRVPLRASTGVWKASLFVLGKISIYLSFYVHQIFFFEVWKYCKISPSYKN